MTTLVKDRPCGCQQPCGCEVRSKGEGFVRPRFFGGMLLCEDDLQALVDYVTGKRRLTNRYVLGAGVVCGLDVVCHPCDDRSVRVDPGYAIDCCGNDIVVSCPEDVDVIDLVRELRRCMGVDCGEPCQDQPQRTYYLYVRYAERPTEPVAPYATDNCATGDCEFSRIREGYCFELRCDPPERCEPTHDEALAQCLPPPRDLDRRVTETIGLVEAGRQISQARASVAAGTQPDVDPPAKADLAVDPDDPNVELATVVDTLTRALHVNAEHAAAEAGRRRPLVLNRNRLDVIAEGAVDLAERLAGSRALSRLAPPERERLDDLIKVARERPDLGTLPAEDRAALRAGYVTGPETMERFAGRVRSTREFLLSALERARHTNCALYDRLVKGSDEGPEAAERVAAALYELLTECACGAMNPPCPCCTDPAVALAAVKVDGCEVVEICALERRWVAGPRALSYWMPMLEQARARMARLCCGDREPKPQPQPGGPPVEQPEMVPVLSLGGAELAQAIRPLATALDRPMPPLAGPGGLAPGEVVDVTGLQARLAATEARLSELEARLGGGSVKP